MATRPWVISTATRHTPKEQEDTRTSGRRDENEEWEAGEGKVKIADERRDSDVEREAIDDKGEKALALYIAGVR